MNEGLTENAERAGKIKRFIKEECGADLDVHVYEAARGIMSMSLDPPKKPHVIRVTQTVTQEYVVMARDYREAEDLVEKYKDETERFYMDMDSSAWTEFSIDAMEKRPNRVDPDFCVHEDFPDIYYN